MIPPATHIHSTSGLTNTERRARPSSLELGQDHVEVAAGRESIATSEARVLVDGVSG